MLTFVNRLLISTTTTKISTADADWDVISFAATWSSTKVCSPDCGTKKAQRYRDASSENYTSLQSYPPINSTVAEIFHSGAKWLKSVSKTFNFQNVCAAVTLSLRPL